ncbi:hypothetical protein Hanom_Chr12g01148221 [Helianthus anomalus]
MSLATGGNSPPDPNSSPVTPAGSIVGGDYVNRRVSTRSSSLKNNEFGDGTNGKSSSGFSIPVSKGNLKHSKADRTRLPLANLNVQHFAQEAAPPNLPDPKTLSPRC